MTTDHLTHRLVRLASIDENIEVYDGDSDSSDGDSSDGDIEAATGIPV